MRMFFAFSAALLLAACATVQPLPAGSLASSIEHKIDRNYTVGAEASAFVGQPVIRVKDYWVQKNTRPALAPDQAFSLDMPMFGPNVQVAAGQPVVLVGTQERDGVSYRIVELPGVPGLGFLVNDDGTFDGRGVNTLMGGKMGYDYDFQPATVKLSPITAEQVSADRGFLNFEIVYSGSTADEINLLYREYTPQDMARPAFTQNLTYTRGADTIRFRDIKIAVLSADNERIRYIVQEDGLQGESQ